MRSKSEILDDLCRKPEDCLTVFDKSVCEAKRERLSQALTDYAEYLMQAIGDNDPDVDDVEMQVLINGYNNAKEEIRSRLNKLME